MEIRVGGIYRLGRKIGGRNAGVYSGTNTMTNTAVAIKLEPINITNVRLPHEYRRYKSFKSKCIPILIAFSGFENIKDIKDTKIINTVFGYIRQISITNKCNIPTLIYFICIHYYYRAATYNVYIPTPLWFGSDGDFNVLVMDKYGPTLEDLYNCCSRKFSLKTVLMIADEMLARIQYIHTNNYIHRNIHPQHFVISLNKAESAIYIINFNLCKQYRDSVRHKHLPYIEGRSPTGAPRYASINNHLGIQQSRRDDLESIGYVLMYFIRDKLPWQGLMAISRKDRWETVKDKKMNTSLGTLCKDLPKQFEIYLKYSRELRFDEKPDYDYCRQLFRDLFFCKGYVADNIYDWYKLDI